MTPAARIQAVIELLGVVLETPRPADTVASLYFRSRRFIGSKDRNAISTRLYRIMREYHRLAWWITGAGGDLNARNFTIAALLFDREHTSSSLGSIFTGDKFAPEPITPAEKKMAAALDGKKLDDHIVPLQQRTECPDWAFQSLQDALGNDYEREMGAMLAAAPMDIRVNILKTTRDELLQQLKREGFDVAAGKISPLSIRVLGRPALSQHPLFRDGYFEIQDEGSQMVALVADAKPGETVADFCAGAGGKTLAIAAAMNNKGRVIAMDVLDKRLDRARERFRRAGLHNIETKPLSSERDKYVKRHANFFDLVLVDAPCSGTGTWRRDPDKRWRQLGPGITTLVPLQKEILDSAQRMVKKGGRLVYATCSLLPEENEKQIEIFLAAHPEFKLKPVRDIIGMGDDYLKMTPAQHDTDGFFAAVMVKQ